MPGDRADSVPVTGKTVAPYGTWVSPLGAAAVASASLGLDQVALDGEHVYWLERRPDEGGRHTIVRWRPGAGTEELTPAPLDVRSRVHEYGGGAYTVRDGTLVFSNDNDGRVYVRRPGTAPRAFTPPGKGRYADFVIDPGRGRVVCVGEGPAGRGGPANRLLSLDLDRGTARVLDDRHDFVSSPALHPDGRQLAWLAWDRPCMPWDGTTLWLARLDRDGGVHDPRAVAGGPGESIFAPRWSPDGRLYFVSDRNGWWNLYRWQDGGVVPVLEMRAEFGLPQWVFGMSTYAFLDARRMIGACCRQGVWQLGLIDVPAGRWRPVASPYTSISAVQANAHQAVFIAASPADAAAVVRFDSAGHMEVLKRSSETGLDGASLSEGEAMGFPTTDGDTAYGFFYAPRNPDYAGPADERPPLLVKCHGGPTAATGNAFDPRIQYWTSRGFAVLDVNYRGSTGYGRAYRELLKGRWGVADVADAVKGVEHLAARQRIDPRRAAIRGSSAGGYTVLCALTFHEVFKAGASYYGISDLEALLRDTHKFEARYLDSLVGPYPQQRARYRDRSPIHFTERLSCPVIFFQGLEDKVVPPDQTQRMVQALRRKGIPVAYVGFPGEQHGFRQAQNIRRALEAELYFYGRVFGFAPAGELQPVAIENLQEKS